MWKQESGDESDDNTQLGEAVSETTSLKNMIISITKQSQQTTREPSSSEEKELDDSDVELGKDVLDSSF